MKSTIWLTVLAVLLSCTMAPAQRTDVSRVFPVYHNPGNCPLVAKNAMNPTPNKCPDLTVDPKRFVSQMEIVDRLFDSSSCELIEGSVGGAGYRRLLRFDTVLINGGDGDIAGGHP